MNDVLFNTEYLQLKSTPSKSGKPWVYAHRPNAYDVVIIITIHNDEVLFLIEERPPLQAENKGKFSIGMPAGLVGDVRKERLGDEKEKKPPAGPDYRKGKARRRHLDARKYERAGGA